MGDLWCCSSPRKQPPQHSRESTEGSQGHLDNAYFSLRFCTEASPPEDAKLSTTPVGLASTSPSSDMAVEQDTGDHDNSTQESSTRPSPKMPAQEAGSTEMDTGDHDNSPHESSTRPSPKMPAQEAGSIEMKPEKSMPVSASKSVNNVQHGKQRASTLWPEMPEEQFVDEQGVTWSTKSCVEVYSNSLKSWCPGVIYALD